MFTKGLHSSRGDDLLRLGPEILQLMVPEHQRDKESRADLHPSFYISDKFPRDYKDNSTRETVQLSNLNVTAQTDLRKH